MELTEAQQSFDSLVNNVSSKYLASFFDWIQNKYLTTGEYIFTIVKTLLKKARI